jgi:imidazole glycerol-phosphate synthase subunit HisH
LSDFVGVVDFKSNNSKSVLSAVRSLGVEANLINSKKEIKNSSRIIIPGVGHIGSIIKEMDEADFRNDLVEFARKGNYLLGICLGQHLLGLSSEESPSALPLCLLDYSVNLLPSNIDAGLRVPHVGWNSVENTDNHELFRKIPEGSDFYFSHSYAITSTSPLSVGTTWHSIEFTSAAAKDNVLSVQFHPEKSQKVGSQLLRNFCDL